jgi:hypothetical protein
LQPLSFCEKSWATAADCAVFARKVRCWFSEIKINSPFFDTLCSENIYHSLHVSQPRAVADQEIEASLLCEMQAGWTCCSVYVTFPTVEPSFLTKLIHVQKTQQEKASLGNTRNSDYRGLVSYCR